MKICGSQNQNGNAILQGAVRHDAFFLNGVFWLRNGHTTSGATRRSEQLARCHRKRRELLLTKRHFAEKNIPAFFSCSALNNVVLSTTSVVEQGVWHSPSSASWICKSWTRCGAAAHYPSERFKSHFPSLVAQPTQPYKPLFIAWKPRRPYVEPRR